MTKRICAALVLSGVILFAGSAQARVLLGEDASAARTIYLTKDTSENEILAPAVSDLVYHLEKMTGLKLNIVFTDNASEVPESAVVLGSLAQKIGIVLPPTKYRDSVRLLTKGQVLVVVGESPQATVNGIYVFLEMLGCDWVMPGILGEVIPVRKVVPVEDFDRIEKPAFPERKLWYTGGASINTPSELQEFEVWKRRQRISSSPDYPALGLGHIWQSFIKKHKDAFDRDPTMYALVRAEDGTLVRKGPQLEPTHPEVIRLFVQDIKDTFKENGWPKDKEAAFGIGPADGYGFSLSQESANAGSGSIDPVAGSPDVTDNLVLLANTILKELGNEYPNVRLGYYSYSVHEGYPEKYRPDPRLNQIFAPINFGRYQSINSPNSKSWPYYRKTVEAWSELSRQQGNMLAYRGYNWNLAENMSPYSKLRIYADEIPWYLEKGFTSVNMEFVKAWGVTGPSDFLLAKLLWNPVRDWQVILDDYCEKAFGAGAEPMKAYIIDLTNRQYDAGQEAGSYHALHLLFDQDFVKLQVGRIQAAISAASKPEEKGRAAMFLGPLKQLSLFLEMREACVRFDSTAADAAYQRLRSTWQEAYAENSNAVSKYVPRYLERFWGQSIRQFKEYSSAPYQIVFQLPDQLKTMIDPYNVGEKLGFQSAKLNDESYLETKTWSLPWDAQGLGSYRSGAVWYRVHFKREGEAFKQPLGLFLGGVDDQAIVWLNGVFVGSGEAKFSVPSIFDLSGKSVIGGNVLVIKVCRNSPGNELGTGGIIRPSFLFSGPEIKLPARPAGDKKLRALPGGEVGVAD